jgi:putative membrane protein
MNDPRVFFAAERTLLAWIRTGLGVMALGFVVERFGIFLGILGVQAGLRTTPGHSTLVSTAIGVALAFAGALVIALEARQYVRYVRTLPADDLPAGYRIGLAPLTASVVAALGAALAVYLALA